MDAPTRAVAAEKLRAMTPKIGFPDRWPDYSALVLQPGDYFGNIIRVSLPISGLLFAPVALSLSLGR